MTSNTPDPPPNYRTFWGRLQSFRYAGQGVAYMLRTQHNAWIHAAISALAILVAVLLRVSRADWCLLILAMASVWTAESFNTALELIVDLASPDRRPAAGRAKDIAAGAVLLCAVGAAAIGLLVFVPRIAELIER